MGTPGAKRLHHHLIVARGEFDLQRAAPPSEMNHGITSPDAPWCWNIYLHLPQKWPSYVGTYSIHGASGFGYNPGRTGYNPMGLPSDNCSQKFAMENMAMDSSLIYSNKYG